MMANGEGGKLKMKVTDIQRKILEAARVAEGRHRLWRPQLGNEERGACESSVAGGYAPWISLAEPRRPATSRSGSRGEQKKSRQESRHRRSCDQSFEHE